MRSIRQIKNAKGKTALVRVDFNVPLKGGKIEDDFRIEKAIPTIRFLLKKGLKIILITHLGKDGSQSLEPVKERFFRLSGLSKEDIAFFENVRKFPGEMKNDPAFAKEMARMGDIYVNDAFSVSHRPHASVVGIPKYLPAYSGFQLEEEIKNLSRALRPRHPFLFILGGAKFSTKMPLIRKYLRLADHIFIGGALANDFLKAKGYEVGKSLIDDGDYDIRKVLKDKKLILPGEVMTDKGKRKADKVKKNETILDVDISHAIPLVKEAKLILWNGPLGKYEAGAGGSTKKLLKFVAASRAESIIGGGDTVTLVSEMKMEKKFTFVSTGGGATLEFLAKGTLPGIRALG